MYNVYQHWDPLKVCIVGKSYNAKFYDYIKNKKVRKFHFVDVKRQIICFI